MRLLDAHPRDPGPRPADGADPEDAGGVRALRDGRDGRGVDGQGRSRPAQGPRDREDGRRRDATARCCSARRAGRWTRRSASPRSATPQKISAPTQLDSYANLQLSLRALAEAARRRPGASRRAVRWILLKDVQILRRSKLLVGLLIVYPIAIATLMGFALSSGPEKPRVAYLNQVPPNRATIRLGDEKINIRTYTEELLGAIQKVPVANRDQARREGPLRRGGRRARHPARLRRQALERRLLEREHRGHLQRRRAEAVAWSTRRSRRSSRHADAALSGQIIPPGQRRTSTCCSTAARSTCSARTSRSSG